MPLLVFVTNNNYKWFENVYPYNNKIKENIFNEFPLYLITNNNYLIVSNSRNTKSIKTEYSNNCAFKMYLELNKNETQSSFELEKELSTIFQIISIEGKYASNSDIAVNGIIEMKDKTNNALKTIYNFIKNKGQSI